MARVRGGLGIVWAVALTVAVAVPAARAQVTVAAPPAQPVAGVAPPSGVSGAASALDRVAPGMSEGQVQALLGPPSDEGPFVRRLLSLDTLLLRGRGWRTYYYRGVGRVVLEGGSQILQVGRVVRVEHDRDEPGRAR